MCVRVQGWRVRAMGKQHWIALVAIKLINNQQFLVQKRFYNQATRSSYCQQTNAVNLSFHERELLQIFVCNIYLFTLLNKKMEKRND